jgi:4-amino-4-deoxy-L-arabinose transferase-like glycosyltransferase
MGAALARPAAAGAAMCGMSVRAGALTKQLPPSDSEETGRRSSHANEEPEHRTVWLVVTTATILAAALRLPFLDHQSLWLDEIYTREILSQTNLTGLWHHIQSTESTPPLYYVMAWLLHARSAVAMRLISALALTAAVPVGYLAFRRLAGWGAALATACILAVNPMLVAYSTDARSYGLFVLTTLLSVWTFSILLESPSHKRYARWTAASAGCIWTHYFGVFVVLAEVSALLATRPRARPATIAWTGALSVCILPLTWLAVSQAGDDRAEFIAGIPLTVRVSEAMRQFAMGPNVPRTWLEASGVAIFALGAGVGVVLAFRSHPHPRTLLALAAIALGTPLLMAALGIADRFYARNVIAIVPFAGALAAPAMLRLRAAPLATYLALATLTSVWVATDWRYQQADWRAALAYSQAIDPHAPVVAVTRLGVPVVQTYLTRPLASSGVLARRAWILVEPLRASGERFLGPAPAPVLPGFATLRSFFVEGFRLVLVGAHRPRPISPGAVPGATVFPGG